MKTDYAGIDYGLGTANVDTETGIRFGVIPQNEVLQAWADESEVEYPECETDHGEDGYCDCEFDVIGYSFSSTEYEAASGSGGDIFITKSPYYTLCQFCSPCAPGAGYLMNQCDQGIKAYCFGHDWFDGGKAPYQVYDVKTGKLVTI